MKRIQEITEMPQIKLKNVKINFDTKLLQYQINQLLYNYNNKYAFPQYIQQLKEELVSIIKANDRIINNKQASELLTVSRRIYTSLNTHKAEIPTPDAIDSTLKYLLFNYTKNKHTITVYEELYLYNDLKLLKSIIEQYNIPITNRITNTYTLMNQLKLSITNKLN